MNIFFFVTMMIVHTCIYGLNFEVQVKETVKTPLYIQYVHSGKKQHKKPFSLETVKKDLLFLDQFDVSIVSSSVVLTKEERKMLLQEKGYCFALFIIDKTEEVDVYIHDLTIDRTIVGKRVFKNKHARLIAHKVSDIIVEALTGQSGFFSTYIAYAKEQLVAQHPHIATKQICIAEYDGSHPLIVSKKPNLVFGLRWHSKPNQTLLYFSQHTKTNVQLRTIDLQRKQIRLISDEDGITMLPTFMEDNGGIVVSATGTNGFAQLRQYSLQGVASLTSYEGNSMAPSCSGKDLYFCSDFKNNSPQIFVYDIQTKKVDQITEQGYCTSPVINHNGTILAYTRMVKGNMQIFLYDTQTKTHRQITFDDTNKDSCSWSPCGTYLLYGVSKDKIQQIAQLNIITEVKKYITPREVRCSSPAWSPVYRDFPLVLT